MENMNVEKKEEYKELTEEMFETVPEQDQLKTMKYGRQ